jgi:hypothetical protein
LRSDEWLLAASFVSVRKLGDEPVCAAAAFTSAAVAEAGDRLDHPVTLN